MSTNPLTRLARFLFFAVLVRGVILLALGLTVRHRERLPQDGPAILAANHNSHLDTLALMSLMSLSLLPKLRPVAAADYFLAGKLRGWFARNIIGVIPLERGQVRKGARPLAVLDDAIECGDILVLFPEGSRGEPEALGRFKTGIGLLAAAHPDVPIVPIYMHGFGKALPKGSALLVPFNCTVSVGATLHGAGTRHEFMKAFEAHMAGLAGKETVPAWD